MRPTMAPTTSRSALVSVRSPAPRLPKMYYGIGTHSSLYHARRKARQVCAAPLAHTTELKQHRHLHAYACMWMRGATGARTRYQLVLQRRQSSRGCWRCRKVRSTATHWGKASRLQTSRRHTRSRKRLQERQLRCRRMTCGIDPIHMSRKIHSVYSRTTSSVRRFSAHRYITWPSKIHAASSTTYGHGVPSKGSASLTVADQESINDLLCTAGYRCCRRYTERAAAAGAQTKLDSSLQHVP
jgi:hypothetical protein